MLSLSSLLPTSADRRGKEIQLLLDEEKSNSQRLQEQVNTINTKMRALRRDKEEVEGELERLQSKNRQLRSALDEAEESASSLQAQVSKLRAAARKAKVRAHVICLCVARLID